MCWDSRRRRDTRLSRHQLVHDGVRAGALPQMRTESIKGTMWRAVFRPNAIWNSGPWTAGPWHPSRDHVNRCAVMQKQLSGLNLWIQSSAGEGYDMNGNYVHKVRLNNN